MHGSTLLLAAVELALSAGLIAAAVFVLVFAIVCVAAWFLIRLLPSSRGPASLDATFTRQVSMSGPAAERLASITETAMRRPDITPETRERLDALRETRDRLASFYRRALMFLGLAGVAAAAALFWQADSANMLGLPAAIILLFGLGALLKGLFPDPALRPRGSSRPGNFRVELTSGQPLRLALGEPELAKAAAMLREGASPDAIARAVHPAYDTLAPHEKRALEQALSQLLRNTAGTRMP